MKTKEDQGYVLLFAVYLLLVFWDELFAREEILTSSILSNVTAIQQTIDLDVTKLPATKRLPAECMQNEWLAEYLELHNNIVKGKIPPRFLIVRPSGQSGMSNHVRSMRAGLLLAVVTDRALFIDWGANSSSKSKVRHVSFEPFLIDWRMNTFKEAMKLHMDKNESLVVKEFQLCHKVSLASCKGPDAVRDHSVFFKRDLQSIILPHHQVLILQDWNDEPYSIIWGNAAFASYAKNKMHLPTITPNMQWRQCTSRILFQPTQTLRSMYCEARAKLFQEGPPLISLHIRTGDDFSSSKTTARDIKDLKRFVACAEGITEAMRDVLRNKSSSLSKKISQFDFQTWMVASDKPVFVDVLRNLSHGQKIAHNNVERPSHSRGRTHKSPDLPLMEMLVLADAPFGIGSMYSSFSQLFFEFGFLPSQQTTKLPTRFYFSLVPKTTIMSNDKLKTLMVSTHNICKLEALASTNKTLEKFLDTRTPFIDC